MLIASESPDERPPIASSVVSKLWTSRLESQEEEELAEQKYKQEI
jgi:hypothetical protein